MWTHFATLFSIYFVSSQATVTYDEITVQLKGDIEFYLEEIGGDFTVGNMVRYGFHTCVTGCDGCINLNNPPNAGLEPSFDSLNALYIDDDLPSNITWYTKIDNLADFWSICATLANMIAIPENSFVPDFKFWTGRKACSTSPNQTIMMPFPDALKGLSAQSEFFGEVFNLTQPQYIALIGGHTLGYAHSTASGFDTLPWDSSPTILNNAFYTFIVNIDWVQVEAKANNDYEWEANGYFMFNSDVCVYKNLLEINATTGQVDCKWGDCPVRAETNKQIELYINNQTQWLIDYAIAYNIMEVAGCDVTTLTEISPN